MDSGNRLRDAIRLIPIPEGINPGVPIFQEPPDQIDETWTHGALVGGLGWLTQQAEIARSYRHAAEALIEKALAERLSWEVAYPILFLYRHAIEITLKAAFPKAKMSHHLSGLIAAADQALRHALTASDAEWVRMRLEEFVAIDPKSTAFRFAGAKAQLGADGEWWIDFRHLQQIMAVVMRVLDTLTWNKLEASASG